MRREREVIEKVRELDKALPSCVKAIVNEVIIYKSSWYITEVTSSLK